MCVAGCASPGAAPPAQSGVAPLLSGLSAQIASLAAHASPAVVQVTNEHQVLHPAGDYFAGLGQRLLGAVKPLPAYWEYPLKVLAVPLYLIFGAFDLSTSHGSAFFVGSDLLLTNAHVVENAATLSASLHDGREVTLVLEHVDEALDLAVLRVPTFESEPPTPLSLRASRAVTGEVVFALGYPRKARLAGGRSLAPPGPTLTAGVLSAVDLDLGGACRHLETDATLNPGNSGGPLLDLEGNVVGISTMVARGDTRASYAIPAEVVRHYLQAFLDAPTPDRR